MDTPNDSINDVIRFCAGAYTHKDMMKRIEHVLSTLEGKLWEKCIESQRTSKD